MKIQHKTTILAQAISLSIVCGLFSQTTFAMQALEDEHLENITGEGIAFVLNDFNLQFNGADTNNDGQGTYGTGYTHLIPVGPLSPTITAHNAATPNANGNAAQQSRAKYDTQMGKGDVYLYGLSISGNDGNANTQFNTDENTNKVNVGSADNPWLIQVKTETVPNFAGTPSDLAYLGIEAPLFQNLINEEGNLVADSNIYNLKLGTWADAFVRDPSKAEGANNQFWLNGRASDGHRFINGVDATGGTTLRENRLRLQAIINGISLNGTSLKIFQTLDGASTAAGLGADYSHYNNTLGLAATLRINSGNATSVRAPVYSETSTDVTVENTGIATAWDNVHNGWNTTLTKNPQTTGGNCGNAGATNTAYNNATSPGCQYIVQNRTRSDSKTRTVTKTSTWSNTGLTNDHVLRLSTREKEDAAQGLLSTPAITGGVMPEFANNEGIYLYNPNINLVLGSQWQPLVLGVADDGKNLVLELTRIPNVAAVYNEIYTNYFQGSSDPQYQTTAYTSLKGGTCSIYWCGGAGNGQSVNATHSSISIGTTNAYSNGRLTAYTGADALGVSFGDLAAVDGLTNTNSGSTTTNATSTEVRYRQRQIADQEWRYSSWCSSSSLGICNNVTHGTASVEQWQYNNGSSTYTAGATAVTVPNSVTACQTGGAFGSRTGCNNLISITGTYDGYIYPTCTAKTTNCGTFYGTQTNRQWTYANSLGGWIYERNTADPTLNGFIGSANGATGVTNYNLDNVSNRAATPALPNVAQPTFGGTSPVNLGSAVIDGLLIQHMKITTKGL